MIIQLFVTFALVTLSFSSTFNLQTTSQCVQFDSDHNVCSKWKQSGTINQDSQGCFIGDTLINQKNKGMIKIKDLKVGNQILTLKNGKQKWSKVEGWLHKNQTSTFKFIKLVLNNGDWVGVSAKHNIAYETQKEQYEYSFPIQQISKKAKLYPAGQTIKQIYHLIQTGMYAPLTSQFSCLVYTSGNQIPILAHDFANIRNPQPYEHITNLILKGFKLYNEEHLLNEEGMNVAVQWMMENFKFLVQ